jgi:tricarballylate dehydrogenase
VRAGGKASAWTRRRLEAVVADYNASVVPGTFAGGKLDDCRTEGLAPPKSHWARRIERPPFHAHPLRLASPSPSSA